MSNVMWIIWETVPQNRSRMIVRSVCNFKTRGERRATKHDQRRRPSRTMWREWKKIAEVGRLTCFDRFICEKENLIFDSITYLEQMERFCQSHENLVVIWALVIIAVNLVFAIQCSLFFDLCKLLDEWPPGMFGHCEPRSIRLCGLISVTDRLCSRCRAETDLKYSVRVIIYLLIITYIIKTICFV